MTYLICKLDFRLQHQHGEIFYQLHLLTYNQTDEKENTWQMKLGIYLHVYLYLDIITI
jgi:hypothetical protein